LAGVIRCRSTRRQGGKRRGKHVSPARRGSNTQGRDSIHIKNESINYKKNHKLETKKL